MIKKLISWVKANTLQKNVYILDAAYRARAVLSNRRIQKITREISKIDSIRDFNLFKASIQPLLNSSKMIVKQQYGSESLYYGHLNALYEYAGITDKPSSLILPGIEHGINFSESLNNMSPYDLNRIFQGTYKKEAIHAINPHLPVYCIGPIIHYASKYYSEEEEAHFKKEIGKTLLIIPSHTYELSKVDYDAQKFVKKINENYKEGYDTIMVCAYWHDVNCDLISMFQESGARIVSAGLRSDANFIRRLKTIISVADAVIGNDIGTYIGYCMYLNKPCLLIDDEISHEEIQGRMAPGETEKYKITRAAFNSAFKSFNPNEREKIMQEKLYKIYWGGSELIKTQQEIKAIINVSKKMLSQSRGNLNWYSRNIERFMANLANQTSDEEQLQYRVLKAAIKR